MFNITTQLGIQSYCFRHFKSIDALLAQVKALGLARTELCEVHFDFNNEASFDPVLAQFRQAGVQISSIGVQSFRGDAATEEKWFKFCKAAGATMISATFNINSVPNAYRVAEKLADKYDLLLGIHNHGGYNWLGNSAMLEYTLKNTSPRIGLCIDSAWCLQSGEDPLKWADKFSPRLYGIHIKDFIFDRAGKRQDVIVGTGNLNLKEFLALALKAPKPPVVTLEYEADSENPLPALKECVTKIAAAI